MPTPITPITTPSTSAMEKAASQDALQAALDALYSSGDFVFSVRVPPPGRKFEKGNLVARKFGVETVAQVCALRFLGCTQSGIQKILGQMYTPTPCWNTLKSMLDGDVYADLRTGPGFRARYEHYVTFFESSFKNYPNWRPSGAAVRQAQVAAENSTYKGSAGSAWQATPEPASVANGQRRAEEAAARRAAARARLS